METLFVPFVPRNNEPTRKKAHTNQVGRQCSANFHVFKKLGDGIMGHGGYTVPNVFVQILQDCKHVKGVLLQIVLNAYLRGSTTTKENDNQPQSRHVATWVHTNGGQVLPML